MKQRPCWRSKPILWELKSFLLALSFVEINLHRDWSREWKRSTASTSFPGSLSYPSLSLAPWGRVGESPGNEVATAYNRSLKNLPKNSFTLSEGGCFPTEFLRANTDKESVRREVLRYDRRCLLTLSEETQSLPASACEVREISSQTEK